MQKSNDDNNEIDMGNFLAGRIAPLMDNRETPSSDILPGFLYVEAFPDKAEKYVTECTSMREPTFPTMLADTTVNAALGALVAGYPSASLAFMDFLDKIENCVDTLGVDSPRARRLLESAICRRSDGPVRQIVRRYKHYCKKTATDPAPLLSMYHKFAVSKRATKIAEILKEKD
jgi:hypothetical protein